MVLPASHRISRVLRYSGVSSPFDLFVYGAITLFGWAFHPSSTKIYGEFADPQPQKACSLVWPLFLSLAATQKITVVFSSSGYLDVSVPRVPSSQTIDSSAGVLADGFPHSDIHGSILACSSPWLFAACRVLLRRLAPWHPPCALLCLILRRLLLRPTVFLFSRISPASEICNWP